MARLTSPIINAVLTKDFIKAKIRKIEGGSFGSNWETDYRVCRYVAEREEFMLDSVREEGRKRGLK